MPNVAVITVSVRGYGEDTQEAYQRALRRLGAANAAFQDGNTPVDAGIAYMFQDPGGGGPCAPAWIDFPVQISESGLPEAQRRPDDDD